MLGPPRLHHTIRTGVIIAKEAAGAYALRTFPATWHPLIEHAVAYRTGAPRRDLGLEASDRAEQVAAFALHVVADANS